MSNNNKARIIVADDHDQMREFVRDLLELRWNVVATVADGKALLEAATRLEPDLLVVDVHMPVLNGLESVRRLKAAGVTAEVIFVSADSDPQLIACTLAMGAHAFVGKEKMNTWLPSAIEEVLAGRIFVSAPCRCKKTSVAS